MLHAGKRQTIVTVSICPSSLPYRQGMEGCMTWVILLLFLHVTIICVNYDNLINDDYILMVQPRLAGNQHLSMM